MARRLAAILAADGPGSGFDADTVHGTAGDQIAELLSRVADLEQAVSTLEGNSSGTGQCRVAPEPGDGRV